MRYGFTTGSCAAAAAKAAVYMLLSGKKKESIMITTPKGIEFRAKIVNIAIEEDKVCCGVVKDGGDDPDVTTGSLVFASVRQIKDGKDRIMIDGGEGVGRVTAPGLDQPIGNAAINTVPRQMIEKEVREVMRVMDCEDSMEIIISVPGGEELAKKTFNERLGIVGGISILGTSGIVEPMSSQALLETIRVELRQKRALGRDTIVVVPGNYGMDFMKTEYGYDPEEAVKCSNFIGDTMEMIAQLGYKKVLLCGHMGKMIKVSGGIMNTHSKEADCRIELMVAAALKAGADLKTLERIAACVTTDAAYEIVLEAGISEGFSQCVMERVDHFLKKKAGGRFEVESIVYTFEHGILGETKGASKVMEELARHER